ncbi:alpha/beta hydrolase [Pseudidiomarina aquimaris]|uniref:Alpha/beta hydrolase n=1 Tax=Pseudidiomarina aquimaris TaxID=641841 RepID=A0A432XPL4_9GAMM|nr:alpha/beta hydrolase-fold protein [Pseudidiomarina aquimaris]RUO50624.1 alpha/beta hydrolase [Pseudidiomarina aquimaris]
MKPYPLLALLIFAPMTQANEPVEIPRSTKVVLKDENSERSYPIFIKTPRSYATSPEKHYPVIYLTDGMYGFQIASGATRFPMNSGAMQEAIIVSLAYSVGSKGASSRIRDYTPSKAADWKLATGEAANHAHFIRETVFSYMQKNYRISAANQTFVGNSLGGLFGAYVLFEHPEMFDNYVLGSPSVWFNDHEVLAREIKTTEAPIKVYLAVGSLERPQYGEGQDMVAGAQQLHAKLQEEASENVAIKLNIIDGAKHATAFPTTLIQGLDWIYGSE